MNFFINKNNVSKLYIFFIKISKVNTLIIILKNTIYSEHLL